MKFADFLNEAISDGDYKTNIDIEKAKELLKEHCSNADITKPLYRGMRGKADAYILQGNKSSRMSLSKEGLFYTIMVNEAISAVNKKYPLRTNSVICTTSIDYAKRFGTDIYVLFPYNDSIIAKIERSDIFDVTVDVLNAKYPETLMQISNFFKIPSYVKSFEGIVNHIQSEFKSSIQSQKTIDDMLGRSEKDGYELKCEYHRYFKDVDDVKPQLLKMFTVDNLGITFIHNKNIDNSKSNEAWVSDKMIAIHESVYKQLIKDGFVI